jgi:glycosyltransferase involved in cell wall biosynthesis
MAALTALRPRVIFFSDAPLRAQLTGPAIRCVELARQVSRVADVTIAALHTIERDLPGLTPQPFATEDDVLELAQAHDVVVAQGYFTYKYPKLLSTDRVKVFDLYDPLNLETLEHGYQQAAGQRLAEYQTVQAIVRNQLVTGDFFLCAHERQRDFYLGMLAGTGRVNPLSYDVADRDMRHLLAVVPVGLSPDRPAPTRAVLRGVHPAVARDDFVLIWGGSLLDWLDPLSLIRAMARITAARPAVKLFFMSSMNPVVDAPHGIAEAAMALSRDLGLLDRAVIFHRDWIAYEDRADYLLEANVGVTTHREHLETRFSVRTRVLDYLWAGLPLISSAGDVFGELIDQQQLGLTVPPGSVEALAHAIVKLTDDAEFRQTCAANVRRIAAEFEWEKVAQPLVDFCRAPHPAIDRNWDRNRALFDPTDDVIARVKPVVRRRRRSIPARVTARVKTAAKRLLRRRYTRTLDGRAIEAVGVLLPDQRCEQIVSIERADLAGFQVLIGTFGRVNTCEMALHVWTASTEVTRARVNALQMSDGEWCAFTFPPLPNSAGRQFRVWLEAPDAVVSDGVTLFRYLDTGELVLQPVYRAR